MIHKDNFEYCFHMPVLQFFLQYFFKLIQLFTTVHYSVSIIDCIKTGIYLQTFKTFTLYKSVQSKM